jgi:hypothetical protein
MTLHATDLIGTALVRMGLQDPLPIEATEGRCCLTGKTGLCIPRKLLIGESFTTQGGFMAPDSDMVGVNVWYAFKHRPERAGNWFCDGLEFLPLDRQGVRDKLRFLCDWPMTARPWAMYVTRSFKKHGSQLAPVNAGGTCNVLFEIEQVKVHPAPMDAWNTDLLYWQAHGISRSDLQSGELLTTTKADPDAVANFLALVPSRRHSSLYRMLAYLLPGKEAPVDGGYEV